MSVQVTWLTGPLVLATLLHLALAVLVWRERPKSGATWFALDLLSITAWSLGQAIVVSATVLEVATIGYTLTLLGFVLIVPTWVLFALRYTGHPDRFAGWTAGVLFVEPVVVLGLGLTNGTHELVFVDPAIQPAAGAEALTVGFGPVLWFHAIYAFVLLGVGDWYMYRKFVGSRNVFRTRTFLILAGSVLMTIAFALSMLALSPLPHHTLAPLTDASIVLVGVAVGLGYLSISRLPLGRVLGLLSGRAKSLAPLARNTGIEELEIGFVVLDHENRVVDVNSTGRLILGRADERVVGKDIAELLPAEIFLDDRREFIRPEATGEYTGIWVETPDGDHRCFDVTVTPIHQGEEFVGRVGLVHDVTHRERRKRQLEERTHELERQNEQLEDFASIVSHDLRNPLNVASGHLAMLDLDGEDAEAVDTARAALDRMEEIVQDVLALARSGQTVEDTSQVSLESVARDAWETVDTRTATLQVVSQQEIEADANRLHRLLENLFRNALEHGGEDVTVTVGATPDGFYVADDGPGITPTKRAEVFEQGYTTADRGTGFGLSIVRTIADAHGWEVDVTESEAGGARFEITDVVTNTERDVTSVVD